MDTAVIVFQYKIGTVEAVFAKTSGHENRALDYGSRYTLHDGSLAATSRRCGVTGEA